jgi:small subunit ribosomal protein S2
MKQVSLEELLEAGCHFGHQVTRQNPKAREFVFEARDNIHIIDLEKTKECLDEAIAYILKLAATPGSSMIILGAKRQAQSVVKEEMKRAKDAGADGLYSVTQRWIGGTMTNYSEVAKNFKRLKDLESKLSNSAERSRYTKKEISLWEKERAKLENFYGGIVDMPGTPTAIFIIDTHLENLAVREAMATGVTTVGITDTNADPTLIKYPIPANDDAVGSIKLLTETVVSAWIEGRKKGKEQAAKNEAEKEKEAAKVASDAVTPQKKEVKPEATVAAEVKPEVVKKSEEVVEKKVTKDAKRKEESAKGEAKTEKATKKVSKKEKDKPVELSEVKKKETENTPEKISVE